MKSADIDFEQIFQAMPTPFMVLDKDLHFVAMNDSYLAMTTRNRAELVGRYVFDAFPESGERQEIIKAAFLQALAGQENTVHRNVFAIERPGEGLRDIYWTVHHTPVQDVEGRVIGVLQYAQDVSAEVAAENMREVISQEYDHRVRNMLAKVSVIARRTAQQSDDLLHFVAIFEPRVSAMARTHALLVDGNWDMLGLRALVDAELLPYANLHKDHLSIHGPDVQLSSRVAQALGLALHELATNAVKYGALRAPQGRLDIEWQTDAANGVNLEWRETGLDFAVSNQRKGFGSTLIDRVLPLESGGTVERTLAPTGLFCRISLPDPMKA